MNLPAVEVTVCTTALLEEGEGRFGCERGYASDPYVPSGNCSFKNGKRRMFTTENQKWY
tara:strand:+ start:5627 stop:5803 length:177 start_codon:yes stop_codon:yes gene_type:complete